MIDLDNRPKVEQTRELVQLLNRTFNTMRLFAPDHPSWGRFQRDLISGLQAYLDVHGELALEVEESRLLSEGVSILEEKANRHSLTFMLYTDGVRQLLFECGMPPEEIQGIMDAFIENARIPEEERDVVCLLWEHDFFHLHFIAVEDLPDAETAALLGEMARPSSDQEMLPRTITLTKEDQERFEQGKKTMFRKMSRASYLASLRDQFDQPENQSAITLNQEREAKELIELVEKECTFNPNQEMADFLLEMLHKEEMGKTYEDHARLSEDFVQKTLSFSDFKSAVNFLRGLNKLADSLRGHAPEEAERIDASLRNMSSREKIAELKTVIHEGMPFPPQDLYDFILLLRPSAIDPLCDLLGQTVSPQVRTSICRGLEKIAAGHEQILALKLQDVAPDVARELLNLLGIMKPEKTVPYLRPFAYDRDCPMRLDVIHALGRIGGSEVSKIAIDLLNDPNTDVREAAVRSIDLGCEATAAGVAIQLIKQKNFSSRPMVEKKVLLEYLGASKLEEGLPILLSLLKKRSLWSRGRTLETRICAAYGLGRLGTEEALEALRKQRGKANPQLDQICAAILRRENGSDPRPRS